MRMLEVKAQVWTKNEREVKREQIILEEEALGEIGYEEIRGG